MLLMFSSVEITGNLHIPLGQDRNCVRFQNYSFRIAGIDDLILIIIAPSKTHYSIVILSLTALIAAEEINSINK